MFLLIFTMNRTPPPPQKKRVSTPNVCMLNWKMMQAVLMLAACKSSHIVSNLTAYLTMQLK